VIFDGHDVGRACAGHDHAACNVAFCECECHGWRGEVRRSRRLMYGSPWRILAPVAIAFALGAAVLYLVAS